jgi:hypothetical protein
MINKTWFHESILNIIHSRKNHLPRTESNNTLFAIVYGFILKKFTVKIIDPKCSIACSVFKTSVFQLSIAFHCDRLRKFLTTAERYNDHKWGTNGHKRSKTFIQIL